MELKKIFLSYSWDSESHRAWVRKLADALEEIEEIHVTWDGYDLDSLVDKNLFMESGIYDADLVLAISTKKYKAKADERSGGVGIETYLSTALHWEQLLKNKKTKIIEIKREADSTPRYLNGHFYFDFTDDANFEKNFRNLLELIRGESKVPRPKKRVSITSPEAVYSFTRVEDIIRVNYPNRRAVVDAVQGTDFSGSNRIKYELWETKSPSLGYFLALSSNINIRQTAQHAVRSLQNARIKPSDLTVLRQRSARPEQEIISQTFAESSLATKIYECTYKEYIWDYCIDETLKNIEAPTVIENYTNQELSFLDPKTGELSSADSATDYLVDKLQKNSDITAHLVVAPGGMGKTSLCLSVAKKLHNRSDLRSSVILIQAESIKKYLAKEGAAPSKIDSIYDIYELYAKYQDHSKIFERATFDLAVVCGNLTIIIDGLDELSSLFQEKFDMDSFLISLQSVHNQLGSSNILLTTRNNLIAEGPRLEELGIVTYELLGFDPKDSKRYFQRRFGQYENSELLITKVTDQVSKIHLIDPDNRVVPFFADIVATVVEDELRENQDQDFVLADDPTPYPSNNDLTDHIIHSIFRRENTRHELDIPESEAILFIAGLVADFGKRWSGLEMRERLEMMYDSRAHDLFSKLSLNPLVLKSGDDFELRYSFLSSYLEVIFTLTGIVKTSLEAEFLRSLARLNSDSEEAREIKRYFTNNMAILSQCASALIPQLKKRATSTDSSNVSATEKETAKRAIAAILGLYAGIRRSSMEELTTEVLSFFGVSKDKNGTKTIDGLFVKGDFPSFDFSDLIVTNSGFYQYKRFLFGRFARTKFMFTTFEGCANQMAPSTALDPAMIDNSCDVGDLREAFAMYQISKESEANMIQNETKKFLHGFFRGDRFIDNKKLHLRFSNKVSGLAPEKFDRLIAEGYIVVKKEKTVATFYEISQAFQPSVRRFLTDGYPDGTLKKFITFVRGE